MNDIDGCVILECVDTCLVHSLALLFLTASLKTKTQEIDCNSQGYHERLFNLIDLRFRVSVTNRFC